MMIGGGVYLRGKGEMRIYLIRSGKIFEGREVIGILEEKLGFCIFSF